MAEQKNTSKKLTNVIFKSKGEDVVTEVRNWYSDRYNIVAIQRNLLILLVVILSLGILAAIVTIKEVTLSKTVRPFMVEMNDQTGVVTVVEPTTVDVITAEQAVDDYFTILYLKARESYNYMEYEYNYHTVVRLMSSGSIYNQFRNYLADKATDPLRLYGSGTRLVVEIKSIQALPSAASFAQTEQVTLPDVNISQVRFKIKAEGQNSFEQNKIAVIGYKFSGQPLYGQSRFVNPLGYIVVSYIVNDDYGN